MESLTPEQQQEVKDVFAVIDANGNGAIDINELGKGLRGLGLNPTLAQVRQIMDKYDTDNNRNLSLDEFTELYVDFMRENPNMTDDIKDCFKKLDINSDGYVDAQELRKVLLYGDEALDEDEAQQILDEFDRNRDGRLSLQEFLDAILGTS